jgi:hypothetical protein
VLLKDDVPYEGGRKEIRVPGVDRTEVRGDELIAIRNGDQKAKFRLSDIRNHHLEED